VGDEGQQLLGAAHHVALGDLAVIQVELEAERSGPTASITCTAWAVVSRKKPGMSRRLIGSITGFTPAFMHSSAAKSRFMA
jgi:hypothetical protein